MKYTTVFRNKYQEYSLFMDEVDRGDGSGGSDGSWKLF